MVLPGRIRAAALSLIISSIMLAGALGVGAQEFSKEHLQKAREAVVLSNAAQGFDSMLGLLAGQAKSTLTRTSPHLANEIAQAAQKASLSLTGRISDFVDKVAEIYAAHFSIAELEEIVAFYKTPTGKKMAERSGQIILETLQANRIWSRELATEMMTRTRQELNTMGHKF